MIHKVDWISFTVDVGVGEGRQSQWMPGLIGDALRLLDPDAESLMGLHTEAIPSGGRKPYSTSLSWESQHIRLFFHPNLPHALFEISGQGCDLLDLNGNLHSVLQLALNRLTRLDVATDMLTMVNPVDFTLARDVGRFKSSGYINSPSGTTCYVGSRSSDRYARVYRYNPPHDRSHLLRCEVQLKGMNARLAAQQILTTDVSSVAQALGTVFGWRHSAWQPSEDETVVLRSWRPERHLGKTEYWLNSQVAPVLRRLHRENILNVREWLENNVLQETHDHA